MYVALPKAYCVDGKKAIKGATMGCGKARQLNHAHDNLHFPKMRVALNFQVSGPKIRFKNL